MCSAVHPLAAASPFLASLPLESHGLEWLQPRILAAHPLDRGPPATLRRSIDETAAGLGRDAGRYREIVSPLLCGWPDISAAALGPPLRTHTGLVSVARFGLQAVRSSIRAARQFQTSEARALIAGMAAHANAPLEQAFTWGVGLTLMLAGHVAGWPFAATGSQAISAALGSHLRSLGGQIETGHPVTRLPDLPTARAILFATSAWTMAEICGDVLPSRYRASLARFSPGPGVFKLDWALSEPIPWSEAACGDAGTLHLGGALDEVASAERAVAAGTHPERPSCCSPSRASSMRPARRGIGTRPGPTAMSPTGRAST